MIWRLITKIRKNFNFIEQADIELYFRCDSILNFYLSKCPTQSPSDCQNFLQNDKKPTKYMALAILILAKKVEGSLDKPIK